MYMLLIVPIKAVCNCSHDLRSWLCLIGKGALYASTEVWEHANMHRIFEFRLRCVNTCVSVYTHH